MVRCVLHFWTTSMNERIRELYRQAHSIRYHDGDPMRDGNPPTVYWQGETSAERFALLIVQECTNVLRQEWYQLNNSEYDQTDLRGVGLHVGMKSGVNKSMVLIRKHFGVEE